MAHQEYPKNAKLKNLTAFPPFTYAKKGEHRLEIYGYSMYSLVCPSSRSFSLFLSPSSPNNCPAGPSTEEDQESGVCLGIGLPPRRLPSDGSVLLTPSEYQKDCSSGTAPPPGATLASTARGSLWLPAGRHGPPPCYDSVPEKLRTRPRKNVSSVCHRRRRRPPHRERWFWKPNHLSPGGRHTGHQRN